MVVDMRPRAAFLLPEEDPQPNIAMNILGSFMKASRSSYP